MPTFSQEKHSSPSPPKRTPRPSIDDEGELWSDKHLPIPSRTEISGAKCSLPWITGGFILFPFYHFIEPPLLEETDTEVAKLLEQRGCLHVPARHILDEFMEKYFLYFHPLVPMLDEQRFWVSYGEQRETNSHLSLFVLQAMLFVSSPYVPLETLIGLGFQTVKEAQDEFYVRATTLFDLQSTLSDQDRAQGAMMLTYRTVSFMDKKPLYWLSIAIHYAKSADAHHYHEKQDTREKRHLKRLWWCCILRDRILALALHQSPLINPSANDTDCPALSITDFAHEIRTSHVYEHVDKQIIVQIVIVLCEFGGILGDIIPLTSLVKGRGFCRDEIEDLTWRLDNWYDETYAIFRLPTLMTGAHKSLTLFSNILCTYYHTCLLKEDLPGDLPDTSITAHTNLGCCLRSITENMIELKDSGLVQYLPITFFSATPFIWYSLQSHMQNSDGEVQRDLDAQLDVMTRFSHLYRNAESTINYVKSIVEHIKISLPLPTDNFYRHFAGGDEGRQSMLSDESWSTEAWTDMLSKDPRRYLRIALAVEFSLSRGRCPAEDDFPLWLRDHQQHKDEPTGRGSDLESVFFNEAAGDFAYGDEEAAS
ncbi:c6 zinc finger domain-containing protein [Fusarium pseudoanthophilum]|uniref:C6 zinc finger domain-containing protein n=1 Tax=Fusarium pseudoanthophilum TaxID=48495 RepID=A0A8H5UW63_9HYPO|nr:c6 zinc finger domain-containing protein [Fusarium pseudoanthophilum]